MAVRDHKKEIEILKNGIVSKFQPEAMVVFGSVANGTATDNSDIDICVIVDTENKRKLNGEINEYIYDVDGLDFDQPVDVLIYTVEEWNMHCEQPGSFAHLIKTKGEVIHGRQ